MPRFAASTGTLQPATRNVIRAARLADDEKSWVATDIQKSRKDDGVERLGHACDRNGQGATTHSGERRQTGGDCFGARWSAHPAGGGTSCPTTTGAWWSQRSSTTGAPERSRRAWRRIHS